MPGFLRNKNRTPDSNVRLEVGMGRHLESQKGEVILRRNLFSIISVLSHLNPILNPDDGKQVISGNNDHQDAGHNIDNPFMIC